MKQDITLKVEHISKAFPGVQALDDVTMELRRGEILGICGENGAGKSTLLKILSGAYSAGSFDGTITVEGKQVHFQTPLDSVEAGIAIIYQEIALIDNMSVADNIMVGKYTSKFGWLNDRDMRKNAQRMLEQVNLNLDPDSDIRTLNTGKRQLIAIAKALASNPKIILLDESTSALTDSEIKELFRIVLELKQQGISCIYISHKMDEIFELCDRLYVLRDGKLVDEFERENFDEAEILKSMVGRSIDKMFDKDSVPQQETVLEVRSLSTEVPYGSMATKVTDVSFSLKKGEILGFAGLVGSGRSETVNAIFGASKVEKSTAIKVFGKTVAIRSPRDAIRNEMALLTEDRKATGLIMGLSIKQNILLPALQKLFRSIFVKSSREQKMAQDYKELLSIKAPGIDFLVKNLSGGNQQKVIFAKWMLTQAKIIFLDEPTRGIDVGAKSEIYSIINNLAKEGKSIIFISSEMPELIGMCDRILVFRDGRVVDEIMRNEATQVRIITAATGADLSGEVKNAQ